MEVCILLALLLSFSFNSPILDCNANRQNNPLDVGPALLDNNDSGFLCVRGVFVFVELAARESHLEPTEFSSHSLPHWRTSIFSAGFI